MPAFNFSATDFTPKFAGGEQLPLGKHPVMIIESELALFANNKGGIKFKLEAIDGPAKGTTQNLSLMLHSPDAADAGVVKSNNERLSAICYVTGVFKFTNTEELHRRPFVVGSCAQKKNPEFMEVKEVFSSDMRKASEVAASGNVPAAAPSVPPAAPTPATPAPEAATAPTASPSNAAQAWAAGDTTGQNQQAWGAPAGGAAPWGATK